MKKTEDGWYQVEVKCSKENAAEMAQWLDGLKLKIEKSESAFGEEPDTLAKLREAIETHGGNAGFIFELFFRDEETAVLAKMKYGC